VADVAAVDEVVVAGSDVPAAETVVVWDGAEDDELTLELELLVDEDVLVDVGVLIGGEVGAGDVVVDRVTVAQRADW